MKPEEISVNIHAKLVQLGAKWLRRNGFSVVATEIVTAYSRETPDVIGFRSSCSCLIEAKASRADFLADAKKPERSGRMRGVGVYRFYLCPKGMIVPDELPPKWGLLYADSSRVSSVVCPKGNAWPGARSFDEWDNFQHEIDQRAERGILFSIARRLARSNP